MMKYHGIQLAGDHGQLVFVSISDLAHDRVLALLAPLIEMADTHCLGHVMAESEERAMALILQDQWVYTQKA